MKVQAAAVVVVCCVQGMGRTETPNEQTEWMGNPLRRSIDDLRHQVKPGKER